MVTWARMSARPSGERELPLRRPAVPHQARLEIEDALVDGLSLLHAGAADDQPQLAAVGRRAAYVVQAGVEFLGGAVRHGRPGYG